MPGMKEGSMNTSQTTSPESGPPTPEPIQAKTWRDKILRNQMLLRQGHEGMMLDKIQRQNLIAEQNAKAQLADAYGDQLESVEEDEMGVSIGNENHYHYQAPTEAVQKQPPRAPLAAWLALALAAAGSGGALVSLMSNLAPPAVRDVDTDTDTVTNVTPGFGTPQRVDQ